jgi:hypothetical protein
MPHNRVSRRSGAAAQRCSGHQRFDLRHDRDDLARSAIPALDPVELFAAAASG